MAGKGWFRRLVRIQGIDEDGTWHDVMVDPHGDLVLISEHENDNHEGRIFQVSTYLGEIADNAETNLLIQIGSNKDLHMLALEATLQGTWELEIFEGPEFTAAGTAIVPYCSNRFTAGASDMTMTHTPTLVATTVDAESAAGQKVLNVTATTNFVAGTTVLIDKGEGNENEFKTIDTIQAGVSLTMTENLDNTYTNEAVESAGLRMGYAHSEGGIRQSIIGAVVTGGGKWVYKSGEDYLFRMTNRSAAVARASNEMWWAEKDKQT